jgi:hypothetical protein
MRGVVLQRLQVAATTVIGLAFLALAGVYSVRYYWPMEVEPADPSASVISVYYQGEFVGSGVVVGEDGGEFLVLTAWHVLPADSTSLGGFYVVRADSTRDLALLSVPGRAEALRVGESPRLGQRIRIFAHYEDVAATTQGVISNPELGWVDAPILAGMSGGAVVDDSGDLVGIVLGVFGDDCGLLGETATSSEVDDFLSGR